MSLIKVVGIGGGGNNIINSMSCVRIMGVEYITINTDSQALSGCHADLKIVIGEGLTSGLGTGGDIDVGRRAATGDSVKIRESLNGAELVFLTAGQGGGTGSGATPVIADIAKEVGALTVAIVTRPFSFEGARRQQQAEKGIVSLLDKVDTMIIIPNDRLLDLSDEVAVVQAFSLADEVVTECVRAISELLLEKGLITLSFESLKNVLSGSGRAFLGIGRGSGSRRAYQAALNAIESPLLESSIDKATRVLMNISGGEDITLYESREAAEVVAQAVDPQALMVFGAHARPGLVNEIRVTFIASGFGENVVWEEREGRSDKSEVKSPFQGTGTNSVDVLTFFH